MAMMIRGVKASGMMGARLMCNLMKIRPFCTVTPSPQIPMWATGFLPRGSAAAELVDEKEFWESVLNGKGPDFSELIREQEEISASAFVGRGSTVAELVKEKKEDLVAQSELRERICGGPVQLGHAATQSEEIKEISMFGLNAINNRQHTNLQLVRVLGAWSWLGPGHKYDITLEATHGDGGGKGKFYRVGVTDLRMFVGYKKLELVNWVLLDHPYPIMYFNPETCWEYVDDMEARVESLRKARPPVTYPNSKADRWSDPSLDINPYKGGF